MKFARVTQPQSPQPTPWSTKMRETRVGQTKTADIGLEGFVDWKGVVDGEPAEEEEMFSLATRFATRMHKQSATLEGEASSSSRDGLLHMRGLIRTRP